MKLYLVTGNKHKVQEVSAVMDKYGIVVEQIDAQKYEPKDMDLKDVARYNAEQFYKKYKKPIAVDDTGVFFEAYPEFPGNHPKLMYNLLGYRGLLKLLEGEDREAHFETVVGFCDGETKVFEGTLHCTVDTKVNDRDVDVLPYERIFLVDGRPLSQFRRVEKNRISHRAKAFEKLAAYLKEKYNL